MSGEIIGWNKYEIVGSQADEDSMEKAWKAYLAPQQMENDAVSELRSQQRQELAKHVPRIISEQQA